MASYKLKEFEDAKVETIVLDVLAAIGRAKLEALSAKAKLPEKSVNRALKSLKGICVRQSGDYWNLLDDNNLPAVENKKELRREKLPSVLFERCRFQELMYDYLREYTGALKVFAHNHETWGRFPFTGTLKPGDLIHYTRTGGRGRIYSSKLCIHSAEQIGPDEWRLRMNYGHNQATRMRIHPSEVDAISYRLSPNLLCGEALQPSLSRIKEVAPDYCYGNRNSNIERLALALPDIPAIHIVLLEAFWSKSMATKATQIRQIMADVDMRTMSHGDRRKLLRQSIGEFKRCMEILFHPNFQDLT